MACPGFRVTLSKLTMESSFRSSSVESFTFAISGSDTPSTKRHKVGGKKKRENQYDLLEEFTWLRSTVILGAVLTFFSQFELQGHRIWAPVYGCDESLTLVPKTKEGERRGGGVEWVVVAMEQRTLFAPDVAEGYEPLPNFHALILGSLWVWRVRVWVRETNLKRKRFFFTKMHPDSLLWLENVRQLLCCQRLLCRVPLCPRSSSQNLDPGCEIKSE